MHVHASWRVRECGSEEGLTQGGWPAALAGGQDAGGGSGPPGEGRVGGPRLRAICGVRRSGNLGRGMALWGSGLWLSPGGRRKQVRTEGAEHRRAEPAEVAAPQVGREGPS